jgi:amino acid transporter
LNTQIDSKPSLGQRLKTLTIGSARSPYDKTLFHKLSLIAFFAWVGLGADGLSSSCYGPEEAFLALQGHTYLGIFIALGSALTIFVISASYSQIIELFPAGGGGYLVASKLLSPTVGMVSGCALLIDYVLTITVSIASGAAAVFSFLPEESQPYRLVLAILGVFLLTLMNLRGVKESVAPLVPVFLIFLFTHAFAIVYTLFTHAMNLPEVVRGTMVDVHKADAEIGLIGMVFLLLRSYSMGAGTYTGIEAVSNGLPILREPRVATAKRTMFYMATSLALVVVGLMLSYLLFRIQPVFGKTLNAVLFERITSGWGENTAYVFVLVTLLSETALLFVAAQAGFLDGPRILANMALDGWFPTRFTMLSDRFVTQNGVLLMGGVACVAMVLTRGSVRLLVVLYSINVFITFALSQLGMVRHWWKIRSQAERWRRKLVVNGVGLTLTLFILLSVVVIKFHEGGWVTLLVTGSLIAVVIFIKRHYEQTGQLLRRLDELVVEATSISPKGTSSGTEESAPAPRFDSMAKTAVVLVNGFNGLGLHTLFNVIRLFGKEFKNFVFVLIGVVDAGNFKGEAELAHLQNFIKTEVNRYVSFMQRQGYYAEGISSIGIDVPDEVERLAPQILERYPGAIFFGGQLVFPEDTFLSRLLHNQIVFAVQRRFYQKGIPFVILPIRV